MTSFGFGRRSRKRKTRRSRRSRRSRRVSRRSRLGRVGNRINVAGRGGKIKSLKIKTTKDGRQYYVTGKRKTKHYLEGSGKRRRRGSRSGRRFGNDSLLSIMGNFSPAQMSLAQSTTGMSAPQALGHLRGISKSNLSNFYTNIR
jgi:hypothetical protein